MGLRLRGILVYNTFYPLFPKNIQFEFQKSIYLSGKSAGIVRILKGQDVLQDDNTLVHYDIRDGDIVSVLMQPDQYIKLEVKCGPKAYKHGLSHSKTVQELKKMLIESKQVSFLPSEFDLVKYEIIDDVKQEKILDDEALPLHYYGVENGSSLHALKPHMMIQVVDPKGSTTYEKFHTASTVMQVKKRIMPVQVR